jgi:hypothetical protein
MNPFTLFKLIKLDSKLDRHLEKIIFTFYLSFGTAETKLIRQEITSLHAFNDNLLIESNYSQLDDLTLWRFYSLSRGEYSRLQYYNWKYGSSMKYHIYYDIAIILLQSEINKEKEKEKEKENENDKKQYLLQYRGILNDVFKTNQLELSRVPNNIGTPSALAMRDHIQIFTWHRKKNINDSLWRLRIMMNWGVQNKLCDMRDVCSQTVYSDLINAYNEI